MKCQSSLDGNCRIIVWYQSLLASTSATTHKWLIINTYSLWKQTKPSLISRRTQSDVVPAQSRSATTKERGWPAWTKHGGLQLLLQKFGSKIYVDGTMAPRLCLHRCARAHFISAFIVRLSCAHACCSGFLNVLMLCTCSPNLHFDEFHYPPKLFYLQANWSVLKGGTLTGGNLIVQQMQRNLAVKYATT